MSNEDSVGDFRIKTLAPSNSIALTNKRIKVVQEGSKFYFYTSLQQQSKRIDLMNHQMHYRLGSTTYALNSLILVQTYEGLYSFDNKTLLLKERYPEVKYTKVLKPLDGDGHFVLHEVVDQWNIYKYDSNGGRIKIHTSVENYFEEILDLKS
jgi:hypothetical protein